MYWNVWFLNQTYILKLFLKYEKSKLCQNKRALKCLKFLTQILDV